MSMPTFPKDGANMTREQALTMIIASIAMEECALGHIIEAEKDKLRCALDWCRESCGCRGTQEEVLAVNESVTRLLEVVAQNQALLRSKLALVLGECGECPPPCPSPCPPPCPSPCPSPCPPPCPPVQKSCMRLGLCGNCFLWKNECLIPWECMDARGDAIRWSGDAPAQVELAPGKAYFVSCTVNIRDILPVSASGSILLEGAGVPPWNFTVRCGGGEPLTLQYSALLLRDSAGAVSLRLRSRTPLCVEQAELAIVEL